MALNLADFQGGTVTAATLNALIQALNRLSNITAMSAVGTASLSTSSTSYVDVAGTSVGWTKKGDASGSDVFVMLSVSCYVGTANVLPTFGIHIGSTDYDLTQMTIVPTTQHTAMPTGFRVISGIASGAFTPTMRAHRGVTTAGTISMDTGDTASFLIGELPK